MKFRPCIDIHNGKVKQIVGSSLKDAGDQAEENFVSGQDAKFFADLYHQMGLRGGHVILLNPQDSTYYEQTKTQAFAALSAHPGELQVGGGITAENAEAFLAAGASHVIVTSYVFSDGHVNESHLKQLAQVVGREHVVLDLSCRKKDQAYYIVTDRWQKLTDTRLCPQTMEELAEYCDEFLVHAADVEGRQNGIEQDVTRILGCWGKKPVTYAGGVRSAEDIRMLKALGGGKLDVTVGSALEIFGGTLTIEEVMKACVE
ncbi:MAG: phosphoribosylformimino-5-aminoimidazole carboxamide ribotide isomerase [Butyrivibrio sp.]|jgi:phosphoribosylformimino-5-aminoimidazole carboxamide ribotide isomerase|nr:phosphoribosylformimino-5-aminoimidazole carboxamide ribotide isomerase [Butyrivibrio sp.]